jgi:hypothetical protein
MEAALCSCALYQGVVGSNPASPTQKYALTCTDAMKSPAEI